LLLILSHCPYDIEYVTYAFFPPSFILFFPTWFKKWFVLSAYWCVPIHTQTHIRVYYGCVYKRTMAQQRPRDYIITVSLGKRPTSFPCRYILFNIYIPIPHENLVQTVWIKYIYTLSRFLHPRRHDYHDPTWLTTTISFWLTFH